MPEPVRPRKVRCSIDRGGTFCDFLYGVEGEKETGFKLLSENPQAYPSAPAEGIRRILEHVLGRPIPRSSKLPTEHIESIRMGTTIATNALLERRGQPTILLVTKGFKDVLRIGSQSRPDIFDLSGKRLSHLFEEVIEIDERVTVASSTEDPDSRHISQAEASSQNLRTGRTGEYIRVLKKPDLDQISRDLKSAYARGYRSVALALLHSFTFSDHEDIVADLAKRLGFRVSSSHETLPMIGYVSRANSAVADAYLSLGISKYIEDFGSFFEGGLDALGGRLVFMQSDGGLCRWDRFTGARAILSGPAGGVVGYSKTCYRQGEPNRPPLLALDMGGTSTDVSRFSGKFEQTFGTTISEIKLQIPMLNISTVAAGGGSCLTYRNGMFVVGPESAGSNPGPACYGKEGPLSITDANLILGRLSPAFPQVFGPNEDEPLNAQAAFKALQSLRSMINAERHSANEGKPLTPLSLDEVAAGVVEVANECMARPIRTLCQAKGLGTSIHDLVSFGGAGGQHMCGIARTLGIRRIVVPKFSSVLSAYGLALADLTAELQEPCAKILSSASITAGLLDRLDVLADETALRLQQEAISNIPRDMIDVEQYLNCRYQGTSNAIMIERPPDGDFIKTFESLHQQRYGFRLFNRSIIVDDLRVTARAGTHINEPRDYLQDLAAVESSFIDVSVYKKQSIYFPITGRVPTPLIPLQTLKVGSKCTGPALLFDDTQTLLVEPGCVATYLSEHVVIDVDVSTGASSNLDVATEMDLALTPDPVALSLFGHRFMSLAEHMGTVLQQTSVSTNIRERLDYSCALFSEDGGLVSNAPHIPVHLGAMSRAVKAQIKVWGDRIEPGDVIVSNTPQYGGTHLPDITVCTPAFHEGKVVFWTASRAHHADIGGISAGSVPPSSKYLWQEGAQIDSFLLVRNGEFDEEGITDLLLHKPARYPGCSGTRTLADNLSDLRAQVAANQTGIELLGNLIQEQGMTKVLLYMSHIQKAAETAVRRMLQDTVRRLGGRTVFNAEQVMDEGLRVKVKISIDPTDGSAVFDFSGTSTQSYGNINAPEAIVRSAVIYVLRSMMDSDIPLNQGCLNPVTVIVPPKSLLSPGPGAAVVAGNVETSQQITDAILFALEACAGSQGTCNNLTFGFGGIDKETGKVVEGFGYYETLAGGGGAGPGWHGQTSHVHMSNTEIGDPENMERKYPLVLRQWALREGSGGQGCYVGGEGCIREIEFSRDLSVAILSESRSQAPKGLLGGEDGAVGVNLWIRAATQDTINLGGKAECWMQAGDRIVIMTPGGAGYGRLDGEGALQEGQLSAPLSGYVSR